MAEEQHGIKELKEALVGVQELSLVLLKHLKDGVQIGQDSAAIFAELLSNEDLKSKLSVAFEGVKHVPAEVKDLSAQEIVELISLELVYVPKFVEALKKS